jgi:hypothetical protein
MLSRWFLGSAASWSALAASAVPKLVVMGTVRLWLLAKLL